MVEISSKEMDVVNLFQKNVIYSMKPTQLSINNGNFLSEELVRVLKGGIACYTLDEGKCI